MGKILTKIKRTYKTNQIKDEKTKSLTEKQTKKLLKKEKLQINGTHVSEKIIKELEKQVKDYEIKWKKETSKNDALKEIDTFESYYKNLKYTFLACQMNIKKTYEKIDTTEKKLENRMGKLGSAKSSEKTIKKQEKLETLKPSIEKQEEYTEIIIDKLGILRKNQKQLITKNHSLITPEFLKNKLNAIKKNLFLISKNNPNKKDISYIADKIAEFNKLLLNVGEETYNKTLKSAYINGKKYYFSKFVKLAKNKNKNNEYTIKDLEKQGKECENTFKQDLDNLPKNSIPYFTLGVLNSFYNDLSISSKKIYSKIQKLRQETDKVTDSALKKGLKIAAPLIPGLIGMVGSVTGLFTAESILLISAIAFVVSQAGYSAQETNDSLHNNASKIKSKKISEIDEFIQELKELTEK